MIRILDVCKVLCHACGNYLEGVSAVFDNHVVRLCWQDFQIRAMKRGCTDEPSIGCSCWYEGISDTHSITERSKGESDGRSRIEGITDRHSEGWGSSECGPRRARTTAYETTAGVSCGETPRLARWMDNVRHVCVHFTSTGHGPCGLWAAQILLDPDHPLHAEVFKIVRHLPRAVREDFDRLRSMRAVRRKQEVEAVINRLRELAPLMAEPMLRPRRGFINGEGI